MAYALALAIIGAAGFVGFGYLFVTGLIDDANFKRAQAEDDAFYRTDTYGRGYDFDDIGEHYTDEDTDTDDDSNGGF